MNGLQVVQAFAALVAAGAVAALAVALHHFVFAVLAVCGLRSRTRPAEQPRSRMLVVIPAHDEADGIGATLDSYQSVDYPPELLRVLVVADNCSDETAAVVRARGYECLERHDPTNRGKGHAIAHVLAIVSPDSYDALFICDADCQLAPDALRRAETAFQEGHDAVLLHLRTSNPDDSAEALIGAIGKAIEYDLYFSPRSRLGLGCGLDAGHGYSARALRVQPWESFSVVEDAEQMLRLARAGVSVRLADGAFVYTSGATSSRQLAIQRDRWASGTFALLRKELPRLAKPWQRPWSWRYLESVWMLLMANRAINIGSAVVCLVVAAALTLIDRYWLSGVALAFAGLAIGLHCLLLCKGLEIVGCTRRRVHLLLRTPGVAVSLFRIGVRAAVRLEAREWRRTPRVGRSSGVPGGN